VASIVSDILSAISVAAIPLVALFTDLTFAWILVLAMLGAFFDPAGYTARKALVPDVAAASGVPVPRLNGWHEGIFGIGWIVGPLAGSLLIAALGDTAAFWAPFALFVTAAILIGLLRVSDAGQLAKAEREEAGIASLTGWQSAVLGAKLIWRDHTLRALTIAVMILAAIYLPTEVVLFPAYFTEIGSPESLGFILAALAAGSVIGSFAYGWLNARLTKLTIVRAALLGTALTYIPMALLPPIGIFVTFAFLCGLTWGPMQPLLNTIVQDRIEPDAQGRVYGVQTSMFYVAPPAAMFFAGATPDSEELQAALGYGRLFHNCTLLLVLIGAGSYCWSVVPGCIGAGRPDRIPTYFRRGVLLTLGLITPSLLLQVRAPPRTARFARALLPACTQPDPHPATAQPVCG